MRARLMTRTALLLSLVACSGNRTVAPVGDEIPVDVQLPAAPDWLPHSVSTVSPNEAPRAVLRVTDSDIELNGIGVARVVDGAVVNEERLGQMITPLYDRLIALSTQILEQQARVEQTDVTLLEPPFSCRIEAHGDASFTLVRQVLYTAGQARFFDFELGVRGIADESELAVIPVELPRIGPPTESVAEADRLLDLMILMDDGGFEIVSHLPRDTPTGSAVLRMLEGTAEERVDNTGAAIPSPVRVDCTPTPCANASAYDAATLRSTVETMRSPAYGPRVIVIPQANTPYQVLIDAADAARGTGMAADAPAVVIAGGGS